MRARRVRAAQRGAPQHAVGPQVGRERELAPAPWGCRRARTLAPHAAPAAVPGGPVRGRGAPVMRHPAPCAVAGRAADRADGARGSAVAGAAAQVAGERLADLRVGRARGSRASRSWTATTRPGVQKPHCTAPASTNACCTACSAPPSAEPLDGRDLRARRPPRPATRHAHTSTPSRRPSTSRTRPARRRSWRRAGRAARAARTAGSRPPTRRRRSRRRR